MPTEQNNRRPLIIAAILFIVAFWQIIGPAIEKRFPGSLDWLPSINVLASNPFDTPELKVLIVQSTEKPLELQQNIAAFGVPIRSMVEGAGGQMRVFDDQTEAVGDSQDAFMRLLEKETKSEPPRPLPWIAVGKGSKGHIGPLPAGDNAEEQISDLIEGYL